MELPTKIRTVEEELIYLREKFEEKQKNQEAVGLKLEPERIEREAVAEYKQVMPKEILHPEFLMKEPEITETAGHIIEKVKLQLAPEDHDEKMQELILLAKEKGIKNALSVLEKLGDYHITDDFHRFISEYVKEYGKNTEVLGLKPESRDKFAKALRMALYEIVIPENSTEGEKHKALKEMISGMEQFYAGLLSISSKESGDNIVSLEIANSNGSSETVFYVSVPESKKNIFEKAILSVFHTAKITPKPDDYNIFNGSGVTLGSAAHFSKNGIYPLKTYEQFDHDPLNALIQGFSKVNKEGEGAAIQLIWSPAGDYYVKRYKGALDKILKGMPVKEALDMPETISGDLFKGVKSLFKSSPTQKQKEEEKLKPKEIDEMVVAEIKKKIEAPIVRANLRILASAQTEIEAEEILESIESSFNQFENTGGNSIEWKRLKKDNLKYLVKNFSFRMYEESEKMTLNLKEATSLIHFHTSALGASQSLKQSRAATAPAPAELPLDGILLGTNSHQNSTRNIFMAEEDRLRHFYTIGQTGTGKSTLLKNMIIQDIHKGNGICMIDPHGTDILDVLANIPEHRRDDVIYFDPAYTPRPMALNMLEYDERFPEQKTFVVNELFSIFKKLYGNAPESMGPAFEQYFRNSALLVMEDPASGNTLVDVSRVLSDKAYRELKLSRCKNPLIVQFWRNAEKTSGDQGLANYVQYVTNKFDVFLSNEIMRPVIAQEKSSFNFREIMDNKKILLVNLSKGRLGEINANLIGLILVGKMLMAALSRVELFGQDFPPFYLYIDEFQNITTDSIATILSEARKYKLSLTIAHQYIAQLEQHIKDAVFGNVGSICAFRVGSEDAEFLAKQFAPVFEASDLMNVDNRHAYLKFLMNGKPVKPFNIETLAPPEGNIHSAADLREISYMKYGRPRSEIEALIQEKYKII